MNVVGLWGFAFVGEAGLGIGAIMVDPDGTFYGCDPVMKYQGTIAEDTESGELTITVAMDVPAGVWLVGGAGKQSFKLPPDFGGGEPVELPIIPGKTTAIFKRMPDHYASFARGFEIKLKSR